MILVTGAAGKSGLAVLKQLVGRGASVRAFVHRAEQVAAVRATGVEDIEIGEFTESGSVARAARGSRVIFHICPNMSPDEVEIGRIVIDAAQKAGAERLVYQSVLHPQVESMPHHWAKLRVEELLFEAGISYTILQPAAFMQNVLPQWRSIEERGIYTVPYSAQTRLGMVDLEDVAAAAATVLTEPCHEGATYELAGKEVLAQTDVAARAGAALGRQVAVKVVPRGEWAEQARASGLGRYAVDALLAMFRYYERHGFWGNPRVLTGLLGREPALFSSFCERHAKPGEADSPATSARP